MSMHDKLRKFVEKHNGLRQHEPDWYESMKHTIGGSELAALLGMSPYKKYADVVRDKAIYLSGGNPFRSEIACNWGTLFEDAAAMYVERDLGALVVGDDICIRVFPGHRNSPDGYCVLTVTDGPNPRILRAYDNTETINTVINTVSNTDSNTDSNTEQVEEKSVKGTRELIALLEIKCPYVRRIPRAPYVKENLKYAHRPHPPHMAKYAYPTVPAHYIPQLWSGLAVSPLCELALFVDSVFRVCSVPQLYSNDSPIYNTTYHSKDVVPYTATYAMGLVAIYRPTNDNNEKNEKNDTNGSEKNVELNSVLDQYQWISKDVKVSINESGPPTIFHDFGELRYGNLNHLIGMCADKTLPYRHHLIGNSIEETFRSISPKNLLGVLPWKIVDIQYTTVARRDRFMLEVLPIIKQVHIDAKRRMEEYGGVIVPEKIEKVEFDLTGMGL